MDFPTPLPSLYDWGLLFEVSLVGVSSPCMPGWPVLFFSFKVGRNDTNKQMSSRKKKICYGPIVLGHYSPLTVKL